MVRLNMAMTVLVTSSLKTVPKKVGIHGLNFMEQMMSLPEVLKMGVLVTT